MSETKARRWLGICVLAAAVSTPFWPMQGLSQGEAPSRKVKSRVAPEYPQLAKKLSIGGTVKVQVVVSPDGKVKSTKLVGGHPLLVQSAMDAVRKWKFESGSGEISGVVEVKFQPQSDTQKGGK